MKPRQTTTLLFALLVSVVAQQDVIVNTSLGPVRGVTTTVLNVDLNIFNGIPYAKPPIGKLRFARPVPAEPWTQTRDAIELPNTCHCAIDEYFNKFEGVNMWNPNTPLNEDCLYLNVWAPKGGSAKKAIIVWIYGGTFSFGGSTLRVTNGKYMAANNDVIVASMNFRSGALGFMSYGTDAPGNVGIVDTIMAIKWIKDNAENFGGDPDKITIMGESSGAATVGILMLSPRSANLFNNAILLSSSPLCNWAIQSPSKAKERSEGLAKEMNCPIDDKYNMIKCLREKDPQTISEKMWNLVEYYLEAPFAPVVDGYLIKDTPANLIAKGEIKKANVLAGVVQNEGNYFLLYGFLGTYYNLTGNPPLTTSEYMQVVKGIAAPSNSDIQKAIDIEYTQSLVPEYRPSYRKIADEISGDRAFKCPTIDFVREMSDVNEGTYLYSFGHRVSTNPWPQWMGVMHGYEIEILFGLPLDSENNYTQAEVVFSRRILEMWTNFAKYNKPDAPGTDISWPKYDKQSQNYVDLNIPYGLKRKQGLRHSKCTFWRELVPLLKDKVKDNGDGKQNVNSSDILGSNIRLVIIAGVVVLLTIQVANTYTTGCNL